MRRFLTGFALLASLSCGQAMAGTGRHQDQAYGPDPDQRYDLYLPTPGGPAPLILMVHGGGWSRGDKEMSRVIDNKLAHWLPRGIALASTNYRMQPKAPPLEQARDVACALAHLQRRAQSLGLDADNVVLIGHSAGAHLIALLAARPALLADAGAKVPRALILLDSGALDVPAIMNARHFGLYDRAFGNQPADWQAASPIHQLRQAIPPTLAVCSSRRRDACAQAEAFVTKAVGLGSKAEIMPVDMSHGDINARLGDDPAYTKDVDRFIARHAPVVGARLR